MVDEKTIKDILLRHHARYPEMRIEDMVKLIYQNEFAGGHMIEDEEESLRRIREEMGCHEDCQAKAGAYADIFEDIGNGLCRIYLPNVRQGFLAPETVNRFFIRTANAIRGSVKSFEGKLRVLKQCLLEGSLPFSPDDLENYLEKYKRLGYPPVSHSEQYRNAYAPSYRVIFAVFRTFFEVFRRIDALVESRDTVIVAIDGNSGAGKSTLASLISDIYDCNVFRMDDFFLTPELRTEGRLEEPGGNVHYERFLQEVISGLRSGRDFQYRAYDCGRRAMGEPITVARKKLNVVEGSYSMHPVLADSYDLKIFLRADENMQRYRILKRNGSSMLERFISEWIPLENKYFRELGIEQQCDLVFDS
jgi:uridine kinase